MPKSPKVTIGRGFKSSTTIKFGAVTLRGRAQDESSKRQNVKQGQAALKRAVTKLSSAGITIAQPDDIPFYFIDEARPDRLVRKLNGRTDYGVLKKGRFKVDP
jgi:hypothetical protein